LRDDFRIGLVISPSAAVLTFIRLRLRPIRKS